MASFMYFDWETQSELDLSVVGTLRYVLDTSTRPLLNSWAIDDGPVKLWCPDLSNELAPEVWAYVYERMDAHGPCPVEIEKHIAQPDGYVVAWNAAFDRHVWQQVATPDFNWPRIEIEHVLDAMAQGQASNLAGRLDMAGRALGLGAKTIGGKANMLRFARRQEPLPGARVLIDAAPDRAYAVAQAIEQWKLYLDYSVQDTELLRLVWKTTRPLDGTEWAEYWASERINDRGMLADLDVCRGAVQYREEESEYIKAECLRLTDGAIAAPTLTQQINAWLYKQLPEDISSHMVKARDEKTGEPTKLTAAKQVLLRVLEDIYASDSPPEDNVVEFIEMLQFGRSSSAVKFEKIVNQEVDSRLTNSYVFNGAGQTGRLCLAAGSLVLVRAPNGRVGEKAIEHVQLTDQVWDGDSWVHHEGVVFSGVKPVFEYDGVLATEDHQVFVSDTEKMSLREAAERGSHIFKGTSPCTQYTKSLHPRANSTSDSRVRP